MICRITDLNDDLTKQYNVYLSFVRHHLSHIDALLRNIYILYLLYLLFGLSTDICRRIIDNLHWHVHFSAPYIGKTAIDSHRP